MLPRTHAHLMLSNKFASCVCGAWAGLLRRHKEEQEASSVSTLAYVKADLVSNIWKQCVEDAICHSLEQIFPWEASLSFTINCLIM